MSDFEISCDWVDLGSGLDNPCLEATFAQLSIRTGQQAITRVLDKRAKTTRDFVIVPLYPLAEWIVANWWALLEESEAPSRGVSSQAYQGRHDFRAGREGYALPALQLCPEGEWTLLKWELAPANHQSVEFLERGGGRVKTGELRQKLSDFVDAILDRLDARELKDTWLHSEWKIIRESDEHEQEFCRLVGWLGLDPYDVDDEFSREIIQLGAQLPRYLQEEVFKAAPAVQITQAARWVQSGLKAIQSSNMGDGHWIALRDRVAGIQMSGFSWERGYQLARTLRESLDIGDNVPADIEKAVGSTIPVIVAPVPPAASMDGLVGANGPALSCYTAKTRPDSQRFLIARGLAGFLLGASDQPNFYSSAQTGFQQLSRSFAAELLAPAHLLGERLSGDEVGNEEVEEIAAEFRVSAFVIDHQIKNHRLGEIIP